MTVLENSAFLTPANQAAILAVQLPHTTPPLHPQLQQSFAEWLTAVVAKQLTIVESSTQSHPQVAMLRLRNESICCHPMYPTYFVRAAENTRFHFVRTCLYA